MMRKKDIRKVKAILFRFKEKDIFTLAAAVSFYAFLSLFPFLIMLLYISSLFLKEAVTVDKIRLYLRLFPSSVIDTVIANLENILESGQIFSLISFLFLVYLAFKVFTHLERALSKIFATEKKREGWKANIRTFSFFLFTAFMLLLLFFSGNTFLVLAAKLGNIPLVKSYAVILVGHSVLEILFFALSYKFLAKTELPFKRALVGGLVVTLLWEILKHIFGVYIVRINLYSVIYGSIGSLILLLLWIYYSVLVYLFGAEVIVGME